MYDTIENQQERSRRDAAERDARRTGADRAREMIAELMAR